MTKQLNINQIERVNKLLLIPVLILFMGIVHAQHNISKENGNKNKVSLKGNGLRFTPNKGQILDTDGNLCPDILYKGDGDGADIYLRKTGISYVYSNMSKVMQKADEQIEELEHAENIDRISLQQKKDELLQNKMITVHRVDMDFIDCNKNMVTFNEELSEGYTNHYYAHCPQGITHVNQYNKITCKNIYNGIDIAYYGNKSNGIKYDLIVKPHADPNQIRLHWNGAENIFIKSEGTLVIKTSVNEFYESIPKVYQVINGRVIDIPAKYILTLSPEFIPTKEGGKVREGFINFSFSPFDPSFALIIDPWASYYGGSGWDKCGTVTTDLLGNVAFTGYATSVNLPVSAGALQTTMLGVTDAFVVKMDPGGTLLWSTYYGGTQDDNGNDISTDATGNIIVAGATYSPTLPLGPSAGNLVHQNTYGGSCDAFLLKLDPSGTLLWATFYGGSGYDIGTSVTIFGNNVYLYGATYSNTGISKAGAFQLARSGGKDVFTVQFASNGTRNWATYVGGTMDETSGGVACDLLGNIYIAGFTRSTNFPVSAGHQMVSGGLLDAFLFKFNSSGMRLWSTYYGGADNDIGVAVATDTLNNVAIGGYTKSLSAIAAGAAYQAINGGWALGFGDGFIAKFNSTGIVQWGTYFGGNKDEWPFDMAIDKANNIYVYGEWEDTDAGNYPISSCAYQSVFGGDAEDQFIAKYNPLGQQTCITYIGGTGHDDLEDYGGITINGNFLYITGNTGGGYPVSIGAFQTIYAGGAGFGGTGDAVITQLCTNICEGKVLDLSFTTDTKNVCPNVPIKFAPSVNNSCDTSGYKFRWTFSGGNPVSSDSVSPTVTFAAVGTHDVKLVVTTVCKKDSVIIPNYITINSCTACNLSGQFTKGAANCIGCGCKEWIMITASGGTNPYTYSWSNGYTKRYENSLCPGTYTINIKDNNGCSININVTSP
ncbi:MAG: SBBP repeat-containing protein [Bacteroidetes bacterium]|nr:SBBP repeat-containing protein [Bacteroidota bacterium]